MSQIRQVTVDALCEHFANDVMTVEEFEQRVEAAHRAQTVEDLKELLRDLPGGNLPAVAGSTPTPAPRPRPVMAPATRVPPRETVVAIMGGATRKGRWTPARTSLVLSIMGGTQLDYREAALGPGVTEVKAFAMMGGVEIVVPPGIHVESHGIGIMGGFDHVTDYEQSDPEAPTLRITGLALMGGVEITVRNPGESARDARRRRRLEHKERRRQDRAERHRRLGRGE
ncbi:MAG: DUF1707 domain-containing protein [Gemmatimonadetes bacterium]|nr:DUF1707 domain-containing protein [Gemmatimonadota bacterium]